MENPLIGILAVIVFLAWTIAGIRIAHGQWKSEGCGGKIFTLLIFTKGTMLYLFFYWIPVQFYLVYKHFRDKNRKEN